MNTALFLVVGAFLALQTSCAQQTADPAAAQAQAYQRALDESKRQLERQSEILDRGEEILKRQEALITLQEKQAQRFSAVLEKWESMPVPRETK